MVCDPGEIQPLRFYTFEYIRRARVEGAVGVTGVCMQYPDVLFESAAVVGRGAGIGWCLRGQGFQHVQRVGDFPQQAGAAIVGGVFEAVGQVFVQAGQAGEGAGGRVRVAETGADAVRVEKIAEYGQWAAALQGAEQAFQYTG